MAVPPEDVLAALARAQRAYRVAADDALRAHGLTSAQYEALNLVERSPRLSGAELARRSGVTPQSANEILTKLEARGLVERRPRPDHGRIVEATSTESARALLARCASAVTAIEERALADLGEKRRRRLVDSLRDIAVALRPNGQA